MVALGLVTLLLALHGVQPSGLAREAKPLELRQLDNEYCEYGLQRLAPHKWCICWGKIDTRIEVLPWDCETRAPKFLSRRKRDRNSEGLDGFLRSVRTRDDFLRSLNTRHLFPQDLLQTDKRPRGKWQKLEHPKPSMLEKAITLMFKQIAESDGGDTTNVLAANLILLPYLHSVSADGKTTMLSRAMSALTLLLTDFGDGKTVGGLEETLVKDLVLLKSKLLTVKNAIVADLGELLQILKDFPAPQTARPSNIPESHFFYWTRKDQNASAEDRKTISQASKLSKLGLEPHDAFPGKSPVSDRVGLIWKLGSAGNYSNLVEKLGKFIAAIGLESSPKTVSESAPKSPVCTEIQDPTTQITEKCSTEPEIQAPENLTQSAVSKSSPYMENATKEFKGNSSESNKVPIDDADSTEPPKIGDPSSIVELSEETRKTELTKLDESSSQNSKPDVVRY